MGNAKKDVKDFLTDILQERRSHSDILWASRKWEATSANILPEKYSPQKIKSIVFHSPRLIKILKKIKNEQQVPLKELNDEVKSILNEIGYDRKVPILRWLGFFVAKILKKLSTAVFVNEPKLLQIKSQMGKNPLLFTPSHKSYCDFVLMSYICFHYEVDIPRIAAGMDFQSMAFMGNVLRDACAFFIRRSFVDDELYSAVFSQYVQALVIYGDAAIEFFIEGTRSRTQKPLMPKYGFLSMTLKPFLTGLVPDITIVPVNLSYDRVLEEVLFAYELLGVPKPKETTWGFVKALHILNENYGNVCVQFGEPISVKKYFENIADRSVHGFGSVEMQDLTPNESQCIVNLAHSIVRRQRELTTLTCFNLIAAIVNDYLLKQSKHLYLENLILEVQWLFTIFKDLAPKSFINLNYVCQDIILQQLNLHKSLIYVTKDKKIQLSRVHTTNITEKKKLRGHLLSNSTMDIAIPTLMLQFYANPCSNFLIGMCFIALIVKSKSFISPDELLKEFEFLCSIFSYEFIFHNNFINQDFTQALYQSEYFKIINKTDESVIEKGNNNKLYLFCINFLNSYISGYFMVIEILLEFVGKVISEKEILKSCQERLESKLNTGVTIHPANLSLDLLTNALQALASMKTVRKVKRKNGFEYQVNEDELQKISMKFSEYNFSHENKSELSEKFSAFIKASL